MYSTVELQIVSLSLDEEKKCTSMNFKPKLKKKNSEYNADSNVQSSIRKEQALQKVYKI